VLCACVALPAASAQPALDTDGIAKAIGRQGTAQGDVYRVAFPRTDLTVTIGDVTIKPGLALGGWIAFRKAGAAAIAHGDLVLLQEEINPVISKLQDGGIEITALHNHLINESPHLMYLHVWGQGNEVELARKIGAAVALTKAPPAGPPPAGPAAAPGFDADAIQKTLGRTGTVGNGVLAVSFPRPETITMMGIELPPSMGMATAMSFQSAGNGRVAATGDFVMIGDEVNPVARALRQHGIAISALHNHMIHGTPELYFMHFWAVDTVEHVAGGLRAAVDVMQER
jgi:biotin operon repressor